MNIFDAQLVAHGDGLAVSFGGFTLPLPATFVAEHEALRAHLGQTIVLGIRPEDMEDAALEPDAPAERRIRSVVELREALGRSEEHTSELQSLMRISYAVFCLKKKKNNPPLPL